MESSAIIVALVYARETGDTKAAVSDGAGTPEVVYVGSYPATVKEFVEVITRFVVSANENGEDRGSFSAGIVGCEVAETAVLFGHGDAS